MNIIKAPSQQINDLLLQVFIKNKCKIDNNFYTQFISIIEEINKKNELYNNGYKIIFIFNKGDMEMEKATLVSYSCKIYYSYDMSPEVVITDRSLNLTLYKREKGL